MQYRQYRNRTRDSPLNFHGLGTISKFRKSPEGIQLVVPDVLRQRLFNAADSGPLAALRTHASTVAPALLLAWHASRYPTMALI